MYTVVAFFTYSMSVSLSVSPIFYFYFKKKRELLKRNKPEIDERKHILVRNTISNNLFLKSQLLVAYYLLHHTLKLGIFIKGLFDHRCLLPPASNPCSYLPAHYSDLMTGSL